MMEIMLLCATLSASDERTPGKVLIIHDEPAPMEVLAQALHNRGGFTVTSVEQEKIPADLSPYVAVFNYVHKPMTPQAEAACIEYARKGGRHILLHHAISSSKRENPNLLRELHSEVPPGRKAGNGFYVEHGDLTFTVLDPDHFITSHGIEYADSGDTPCAFTFVKTEIFLNLKFPPHAERTVLYGILYQDGEGVTHEQPAGGWVMKTGQGYSFYLQAGHHPRDFENLTYQRVLLNCLLWKP